MNNLDLFRKLDTLEAKIGGQGPITLKTPQKIWDASNVPSEEF